VGMEFRAAHIATTAPATTRAAVSFTGLGKLKIDLLFTAIATTFSTRLDPDRLPKVYRISPVLGRAAGTSSPDAVEYLASPDEQRAVRRNWSEQSE
jgi:hypothetical protein